MVTENCAVGTLQPYVPSVSIPWDRDRVLHLYRRMGYSANKAQIDAALTMSPTDLVDSIIDQAINAAETPAPEWAYWTFDDYDEETIGDVTFEQRIEWGKNWLDDTFANPFRAKLVLFWHNHFVTQIDVYEGPTYLYQYYNILERFAMGNLKEFAVEIGKTPAMLLFLNGVQNTNQEPNENYGRELYELFTLGVDNGYTQQDIVETARALTGWVNQSVYFGSITFAPFAHDSGTKTIFGQTGNWGYDDVHDILFEQRGDLVAKHICGKLYRYFVNSKVDDAIIDELALTLQNNDFEIEPVLRQLFKSEHFFDDAQQGVKIKSPFDIMLNFVNETQFPLEEELKEQLFFLAYELGQGLFNPINVAGWQGNRSWINNNSLVTRWDILRFFTFVNLEDNPQLLVDIAVSLAGSATENDPAFITQVIADFFIPKGLLSAEEYDRATITFKADIPQNYYDDGSWNLSWESVSFQVALLIEDLLRRPEFQLS